MTWEKRLVKLSETHIEAAQRIMHCYYIFYFFMQHILTLLLREHFALALGWNLAPYSIFFLDDSPMRESLDISPNQHLDAVIDSLLLTHDNIFHIDSALCFISLLRSTVFAWTLF
jgi:hypothetical protein